tara:strand:+ start:242 stop:601 length:360 start_codon:yes stop_codon:yes gene_type:complete
VKLYGVYQADGGLVGELTYMVGKLMGTRHCALCDITHGALTEKKEFQDCKNQLPIPIHNLHLNEQPAALKKFTKNHTPCVVLENDGNFIMAMTAAELEACKGQVVIFQDKITQFLQRQA